MEQQKVHIDPNLNADCYRNLTAADQPPINDKQLEVILINEDGGLILGASNMIDRYWNGTIWLYKDATNFNREKYNAAMRTESGVRAATILDKYNKFVVGEDSGLLQVFEIVLSFATEIEELQSINCACQHDDSITSISAFSNNTNVVSAGMDSCIKVWDTEEMIATYSFNQAQTDIVTDVDIQVDSSSVFASTSLDYEALLWDIRKSKPALSLWKKINCGLTAVTWKPDNENIIAIGGLDGSICIFDIRNTGGTPLHETIEFSRAVQKLLFNPAHPNQLAGCCDATEVKVFDVSNNCKNIFENNTHKDFVRDLAWHNNELITCSWDNAVIRHSVIPKV